VLNASLKCGSNPSGTASKAFSSINDDIPHLVEHKVQTNNSSLSSKNKHTLTAGNFPFPHSPSKLKGFTSNLGGAYDDAENLCRELVEKESI
jgi:hypothetical protein